MKKRRKTSIKKFKFKLDPLLRLRKVEENIAMGELAKVIRRVNEQEDSKDRASRAIEKEMSEFTEKYSNETNTTLFSRYSNYIDRLEGTIKEADGRLAEIQPELQAEQGKVIAARKQRRIVELLKERAKARYDADLARHERKVLQELNLMKASQTGIHGKEDVNENKYKGMERPDQDFIEEDEINSAKEEEQDQQRDPVEDYLKQLGLD